MSAYKEIWSWKPDRRENYLDRLSWLTHVSTSASGKESRRRLRASPRRRIEFLSTFVDASDKQRLDALLFRHGHGPYLVPLWWDVAIPTSVENTAGTLQILGTGIGANRDWRAGSYGVLTDGDTWHDFEISSVGPDGMTSADEAPAALTDGRRVTVYPALPAVLPSSQSVSRIVAVAQEQRLAFDVVDYVGPDDGDLDDQFGGLDVLAIRPDMSRPIDASFDWMQDRLDFDVGSFQIDDEPGRPYVSRQHHYRFLEGRADIWQFFRWLQKTGGRHLDFWAPDWQQSLTALSAGDAGGGTYGVIVEPVDYLASYAKPGRNHLYLRTIEGNFARQITGAIDVSGNTFLQVSGTLPEITKEQIRQCAWLERVRLQADTVEISRIGPEMADITLSLRMLDDDL